jgi:hypothetical protein
LSIGGVEVSNLSIPRSWSIKFPASAKSDNSCREFACNMILSGHSICVSADILPFPMICDNFIKS